MENGVEDFTAGGINDKIEKEEPHALLSNDLAQLDKVKQDHEDCEPLSEIQSEDNMIGLVMPKLEELQNNESEHEQKEVEEMQEGQAEERRLNRLLDQLRGEHLVELRQLRATFEYENESDRLAAQQREAASAAELQRVKEDFLKTLGILNQASSDEKLRLEKLVLETTKKYNRATCRIIALQGEAEGKEKESKELEKSLRAELEELKIAKDKEIAQLKTESEASRSRYEAELARERSAKEQHEAETAEKQLRVQKALRELNHVYDTVRKQIEDEMATTPAPFNASLKFEVKQKVLCDIASIVEDALKCSICRGLLIDATTLNCSHTVCQFCLSERKKVQMDCPVCRGPITSECRSSMLDSFIERMVAILTIEMRQNRRKALTNRNRAVSWIAGHRGRSRVKPTSMSGQVIAGIPGSVYRGSNCCYTCGAQGHYDVGCPFG